MERELSEEALKIEEVMSLIREAVWRNCVQIRECYDKLVREFLVNVR